MIPFDVGTIFLHYINCTTTPLFMEDSSLCRACGCQSLPWQDNSRGFSNCSSWDVWSGEARPLHHHCVVAIMHWVLSELKKGQVRVYDSLYMSSISESLTTQLKALYTNGDKSLTISVPRTLQQQDCNDCACYALAYIVHILHGEDPVRSQVWPRKDARTHSWMFTSKKLWTVSYQGIYCSSC